MPAQLCSGPHSCQKKVFQEVAGEGPCCIGLSRAIAVMDDPMPLLWQEYPPAFVQDKQLIHLMPLPLRL